MEEIEVKIESCEHGFNGKCCCNCKNQIILTKHPMNSGFGEGSISDICGYVCLNPELTEGKSGMYMQNIHGICEGHSNRKK